MYNRKLIPLCLITSLALACGDEPSDVPADGGTIDAGGLPDSGIAPDAGPSVSLGDIQYTVEYSGAQQGTLSVAVMTSWPPMGPPVGATSEPSPTFPATGKVRDVEPGQYFVIAVLDVGSNNPQSPGPEDLFGMQMVEVVEGQEPAISITLLDP